VRSKDALGVSLDGLLYAKGGIARPDRVVLVGKRRAEQRHDPVAHDLVHRALVAVDGFHHVLKHGIEDPARFLRVSVGEQFHRALQVSEQNRDLLAFTFEGRLRVQDAFG
jgi:hypothetical protein